MGSALNQIAAGAMAGMGWHIIPLHWRDDGGLCSCGNPSCQSPAKHPLTHHGVSDASGDGDVIERWWSKWPYANVGIACGPRSDLVVLDIDGQAGRESLAELEALYGKLPSTTIVKTANGLHYYFRHPDAHIRNFVRIAPGIDVRADGGYVVAPPSTHASGRVYEWFCREPLAQLPQWVSDWLSQHRRKNADAQRVTGTIDQGSRNNTLAREAGALRRRGYEPGEIAQMLEALNRSRCNPPLPGREVEQIAASIGRRDGNAFEPEPYDPETGELRPLEMFSWSTAEVKETEWLAGGYVPRGVCLLVGAEMKVGKTWWLADLAIAMSHGQQFMGAETQKAQTLIFSPESHPNKFARRLQKLCWGRHLHPSEVQSAVGVIQERKLDLTDPDTLARLRYTIEKMEPDCVILDPLINLHSGQVDENSADMMPLLENIRSLQVSEHMTVIVAHHLNKAHGQHSSFHGLRGHSSIGGWTDGLVTLSKMGEAHDSQRQVRALHRDEESPDPTAFKIVSTVVDPDTAQRCRLNPLQTCVHLRPEEIEINSGGRKPNIEAYAALSSYLMKHGATNQASLSAATGVSRETIQAAHRAGHIARNPGRGGAYYYGKN